MDTDSAPTRTGRVRSLARALGASFLLCAGFSTWIALRLGGVRVTEWVDDLGLLAASAGAGISCLVAARSSAGARQGPAWRLLGLSCLAWSAGQGAWSYYQLIAGTAVPFPGWADVGYLASMPLACAGVLTFSRRAGGLAARLRMTLDGLIITSATLFVSWALVLGPSFRARSGSLLAQVVGLSYPAGYVAIFTVVVFVGARRDGRVMPGFGLFALGLGALAAVSGAYTLLSLAGRYYTGHPIDVGWLASFALIAVAGRQAARPRIDALPVAADPGPSRVSIALPYVPVAVAGAVGTAVALRPAGLGRFLSWDAAVIVVLLVARQLLTLLENRVLTSTLEAKVDERTRDLSRSEERFRALVQHSTDMLLVVGEDGQITYASPAVEQLLGYSLRTRAGIVLRQIVHPEDDSLVAAFLAAALTDPGTIERTELRLADTAGQWRDIEVVATNLLEHPAVGGLVVNGRDVTERRQAELALAHQALHDPLTGLANRTLFLDRLTGALDRLARHDGCVAVLFVDLDLFKVVNDSLGHQAGDLVLGAVAQRLQAQLRAGDTVARFGGDEFVVICEDLTGAAEATAVAARVAEVLRRPFTLDEREVTLTASVGIVLTQDAAARPEHLLRDADAAMYHAKAKGRARHAIFDQPMRDRAVRRLELADALRRACDHGELQVYYQPQLDLADGRVVGVEALARWRHPSLGLIPPGEFIPLAEETGLIVTVGTLVLNEACRQARRWSDALGGAGIATAVNLSARQLCAPDIVEVVSRALAESGLAADRLHLEITESAVVGDIDAAIRTIRALQALGVAVGLDDFGTGYSSLSYLKLLPIDFLKIDRSFVVGLGAANAADTAILDTIVRLATSLGLATIAEGVETPGEAAALRRLRCATGQGYLWSEPKPPEELIAWINRHHQVLTAGILRSA